MSKQRKSSRKDAPGDHSLSSSKSWRWAALLIAVVILAGAVVASLITKGSGPTQSRAPSPRTTPTPPPASNANSEAGPNAPPKMETMEVAKAVMVTVELDFGPKVPTIREALTEIERRYAPADGQGRTFAILDAYGEPTPDGKLHISMHVSSEKPGAGSLVFRRTGKILWQSKITPASAPPPAKNLNVIIDNGRGTGQMIDGSMNPASILDAKVRDLGIPVREFWPDGAEREVTFVYSACGCPVKVMVRRTGETTARTKELPVIFPDDEAAVSTIARLMKW